MNMRLRSVALLASLTLPGLVAGCAEQPPPPAASQTRRYAIDFQGAAKSCTAPAKVALSAASPTQAAITVANDGGWCAITVSQPGPKPFAAGLLTTAPTHGKVYVHTVGDDTRIDYTPDPGYAGPDSYAVHLLPGQSVLGVAVSVTPGPMMTAPVAAAPPSAAPPSGASAPKAAAAKASAAKAH